MVIYCRDLWLCNLRILFFCVCMEHVARECRTFLILFVSRKATKNIQRYWIQFNKCTFVLSVIHTLIHIISFYIQKFKYKKPHNAHTHRIIVVIYIYYIGNCVFVSRNCNNKHKKRQRIIKYNQSNVFCCRRFRRHRHQSSYHRCVCVSNVPWMKKETWDLVMNELFVIPPSLTQSTL